MYTIVYIYNYMILLSKLCMLRYPIYNWNEKTPTLLADSLPVPVPTR